MESGCAMGMEDGERKKKERKKEEEERRKKKEEEARGHGEPLWEAP